MTVEMPRLTLSVRQPWAWAIIYAGKDIENRTQFAMSKGQLGRAVGQRISIHAAKGLTREGYETAAQCMADLGVTCPQPWQLDRGYIIGSVLVTGLVHPSKGHPSPWWMGGHGLLLAEPEACRRIPAVGQLGLFQWAERLPGDPPPMARWMTAEPSLPKSQPASDADLFGGETP